MATRALIQFVVAVFVFGLITRLAFAELSWSSVVVRSLVFGVLFQGAMFLVGRRNRS